MSFRVAILTSHVIQYQDPLFKRLAADPELDLTVYFCSRDGLTPYHDKDLGVTLKWDLDFLSGYRHVFLRNYSPFRAGMLRLFNPGIVSALRRGKYDAVVCQGWGSLTMWLAFLACWATKTPILLNGDNSFVFPAQGLRSRLREVILHALFERTAGFLLMGPMNGDFYRHYGADPSRFFHFPYAIDNDRFARASTLSAEGRAGVRDRYGIPTDRFVVLFAGKLIRRKNPHHLIQAASLMRNRERVTIAYLGDGLEREPLRALAQQLGVSAVFMGFVNQADLPSAYAMADVIALPSSHDPRGTVVNEALACGLPAVISNMVGIYGPGDIVRHGENGFVYPVGDNATLASILDSLIEDTVSREAMSRRSREIIMGWSFEEDVRGLVDALRSVTRRVARPRPLVAA